MMVGNKELSKIVYLNKLLERLPVVAVYRGDVVLWQETGIIIAIYTAINGLPANATQTPMASSSWHTQPATGELVQTKVGEQRITGARRVENKVVSSEDLTLNNYVDDFAASASYNVISFTSSASRSEIQPEHSFIIGEQYRVILKMRSEDKSQIGIRLFSLFGSTTERAVALSSSSSVYATDILTATATASGSLRIGFENRTILGGDGIPGDVTVEFVGIYIVDSNIIPDIVSTEIHNAGVPGVKYFTTENGNTVDSNGVVTEGVGVDLPGPFGALFEPGATNLMTNPLFTGLTEASDGIATDWRADATRLRAYTLLGLNGVRLRRGTGASYTWLYQSKGLNDSLDYYYSFYAEYNPLAPSPWIMISCGAQNVINPSYSANAWINLQTGLPGTVTPNGSVEITEISTNIYKVIIHSSDGIKLPLISLVSGNEVLPSHASNSVWPDNGVQDYDISHTFAGPQLTQSDTATSFITSTRTTTHPIVFSGIESIANLSVTYFGADGVVKTEPLLGDELIVNGDFSDGSNGWTANTVTFDTTQNTLKSISNSTWGNFRKTNPIVTEPDSHYLYIYNLLDNTTGLTVRVGNYNTDSSLLGRQVTTPGIYASVFTATSNGAYFWYGNGSLVGGYTELGHVSLRKLHHLVNYDPDTDTLTLDPAPFNVSIVEIK